MVNCTQTRLPLSRSPLPFTFRASLMVPAPTSAFHQFARDVRVEIDEALERYTEFDDDCPQVLRKAIRHSLLAPGKRLRPLLVLMATEACGCPRGRAMPAAAAVEMVHTYSLVHDDLPAMDDDDMRRGRPACHAAFGEAVAILAGDALLALAFEVMAREIQPPSVAAQCCAALAHAAGASALVGGQADDLAAEFGPGSVEQLERIDRRKTGAMIGVALRLGGLIAGATSESLHCLDEYGRKLGLAFQIVDDFLDVKGDAQALGKRAGKDQTRGKVTFPAILGVPGSVARAERLAQQACDALSKFGREAVPLTDLARYVVERDH